MKAFTRRRILKAIPLIAGIFGIPQLARSDEPLEKIIVMSMVNETGNKISHNDLTRIAQEFKPYMEELVARLSDKNGYPQTVKQIVQRSYPDYRFASQERAEPFVQLGKQLIGDALSYWQCDQLAIPSVSYTVPTREVKVTVDLPPFSEDKTVVVNILEKGGTRYETKAILHYPAGDLLLNFDLSLPVSGSSDREYAFSKEKGEIQLQATRKPALWMVGEEDLFSVYETPPHEVLHNQISTWTDRHLLESVRKLNPPQEQLHEAAMKLALPMLQAEETLVDGISAAWVMDYAQRHQWSLVPYYTSEASQRLALKLREKTPQTVIGSYIELGPLEFARTI